MLKVDLNQRLAENKCFICKEDFKEDDEIREVFDKAFNVNVKIHKKHHFFSDVEGLILD